MMQYNQIAKQTMAFQKNSFQSSYKAIATVLDQAAAAVEMILNQTSLVPEKGRQAIKNWVDACQAERDRFKTYVEDGFAGLEEHLAGASQRVSARAKK